MFLWVITAVSGTLRTKSTDGAGQWLLHLLIMVYSCFLSEEDWHICTWSQEAVIWNISEQVRNIRKSHGLLTVNKVKNLQNDKGHEEEEGKMNECDDTTYSFISKQVECGQCSVDSKNSLWMWVSRSYNLCSFNLSNHSPINQRNTDMHWQHAAVHTDPHSSLPTLLYTHTASHWAIKCTCWCGWRVRVCLPSVLLEIYTKIYTVYLLKCFQMDLRSQC